MNKEELKAIEYLQAYIKNDKEDIKILNNTIDEDIDYYTEVEPIQKRVKYLETIKNLIEKLKKENEELKNKVFKREKEIIELEEYANKNFARKDDVKAKYIPKDKIREIIEELENEEKALRKDFEKHRVQLFELYKKVVLIEGYKKLLEEE